MDPHRIMAVQGGHMLPLFGAAFTGRPSPSPTLAVEAVTLAPADWQSHSIPRQMITLFLQPAMALHSEQGGPTRKLVIPAQSLAFSLRNKLESTRWDSAAKLISLTVDDGVLARAAEAICRGARFELLPSPQVRDAQLSTLLLSLYHAARAGYPAGRLYVDGIEQALAAALVSSHNALAGAVHAAPSTLPPASAQRLVDYLHAHLDQPVTLAELAALTGYSQSHFGRLFKASFGMPAHQYLMRLRVERAIELLRAPQLHSMLDIAILAGFANAQHFSRIFFGVVGMTPSAFRRAA